MNTRKVVDGGHARVRWIRQLSMWSIFPVGFVILAFAIYGRPMAEKAATLLVMPITFAWWVSMVLALRSAFDGRFRTAFAVFALSCLIYVACNPLLTRILVHSLEARVTAFHPNRDQPLDTIVVLGGGTSEAPDGRAQLAQAGDRVGKVVQLYHQGLVKRIIVSGDGLTGSRDAETHDPSTQAKRFLIESGVPESVLDELPGINTSQEMRELKSRPELWQAKRCGLLTSAFHMPRALGLATRNGIDVVPIVADYRALNRSFSLLDLLPSSSSAQLSELALREYLGMLLGR